MNSSFYDHVQRFYIISIIYNLCENPLPKVMTMCATGISFIFIEKYANKWTS